LSKEVSSISVTYKETIKSHRLNTSSVNRTIKVDFAAFGEYRLMAVTDTDESTIDLTSVYNGTDFFQIHPTQVAQLPKKDSAIDNCLYCIESLFLKIRDSH